MVYQGLNFRMSVVSIAVCCSGFFSHKITSAAAFPEQKQPWVIWETSAKKLIYYIWEVVTQVRWWGSSSLLKLFTSSVQTVLLLYVQMQEFYLMNVLRRCFRQKRGIVTSYIRVLESISSQTWFSFILIMSLQPMFGSQVEEQRYLLPAQSHFITVSHCITAVELLQCCPLIADSAHCCSSRGLVWNPIICSPPAAFI